MAEMGQNHGCSAMELPKPGFPASCHRKTLTACHIPSTPQAPNRGSASTKATTSTSQTWNPASQMLEAGLAASPQLSPVLPGPPAAIMTS